jgi:hypothetical protein
MKTLIHLIAVLLTLPLVLMLALWQELRAPEAE